MIQGPLYAMKDVHQHHRYECKGQVLLGKLEIIVKAYFKDGNKNAHNSFYVHQAPLQVSVTNP